MSNTLYSAKQSNVNNYFGCFDALITPILMYGCEIWAIERLENKSVAKILSGQKHLLAAEKLESKMLKFLLGVPRGASNIGVRCELSRQPLRKFAISQILKYYYRLKLGCNNTLVSNIFREICDQKVNPFSKLLTMLVDCQVQLPNPPERKYIKNKTQKAVNTFSEKMYDMWDNEIECNRKLTTFNSIKESYDAEFYVHKIEDRHARKLLASLRLSCHPLRIESGRYRNIARENRLCENCTLGEIEDEEHFVTTCPLYYAHRSELYKKLDNFQNESWNNCNSVKEKFRYIMQPKDTHSAILVINFIKSALETRQSNMYNIIS